MGSSNDTGNCSDDGSSGKQYETPCSQVSTAPGTPASSFVMPDTNDVSENHLQGRTRTINGMQTETLIYVDVDGVLNVGVDDGNTNPLSFDAGNIEVAERLQKIPEARQNSATRKMLATYVHKAAGENQTYAEICSNSNHIVDMFVERLASIIKAAGSSSTVVLSSSWRMPCHARKLPILEKAMSRFMGSTFTFEVKTALKDDPSPTARLGTIADHVAKYCATQANQCSALRILVLEDFHIQPMGSWSCCGEAMTSAQDVEMFLAKRVPPHIAASAKLIHTYDAWTASNGTYVQIGSGLTLKLFNEAMQYLSTEDLSNGASAECDKKSL